MPELWLFIVGCVVLGIAVAGIIISVGVELEPEA